MKHSNNPASIGDEQLDVGVADPAAGELPAGDVPAADLPEDHSEFVYYPTGWFDPGLMDRL